MKTGAAAVLMVGALAVPAMADIPEGDVHLTVENGRIVTGLIAEDESTITPGVRVFYGELGADIPNVGNDPGLMGQPGTFAPNAASSIDYVSSTKVWNGTGFVDSAFGFTVTFGPSSSVTPATDIITQALSVPADADGQWHHHPAWTLDAAAPDGVYAVAVRFNSAGVESSEPFWFLWGQNVDATTAEAAYDAATSAVPAPAGVMLLASAGIFASRRRR